MVTSSSRQKPTSCLQKQAICTTVHYVCGIMKVPLLSEGGCGIFFMSKVLPIPMEPRNGSQT